MVISSLLNLTFIIFVMSFYDNQSLPRSLQLSNGYVNDDKSSLFKAWYFCSHVLRIFFFLFKTSEFSSCTLNLKLYLFKYTEFTSHFVRAFNFDNQICCNGKIRWSDHLRIQLRVNRFILDYSKLFFQVFYMYLKV